MVTIHNSSALYMLCFVFCSKGKDIVSMQLNAFCLLCNSVYCRCEFSSFYRYCGSQFYLRQNTKKGDSILKGINPVACLS